MSKIFRSGLTVKGGVFTADSASVSGSVFFTSGNLGNWTVSSSGISGGNITSGSANFNSASISGSVIATQSWVTSQGYGSGGGSSSSISASAGTIGGWIISPSSLYNNGSASSYVGLQSASTASYAFFAGASSSAGISSKFYVTPDGTLTSNSANIAGVVTFTSGTLGPFAVSSSALTSASGAISASTASFANINLTNTSSTTVPLTIVGASSQSADLQQWKNSSGSVIMSVSASTTPVIIKNVQNTTYTQIWQNSSGNSVAVLSNVGGFLAYNALQILNTGNICNNTGTTAGFLQFPDSGPKIGTTTASNVTLTLKSASAQSADIQQWQNFSGSVIANVNASGGANFVSASISGSAIATQTYVTGTAWNNSSASVAYAATSGGGGGGTSIYPAITYAVAGVLSPFTGTFRFYNDSGGTRTIQSVRASLGTPATGRALIVDVQRNSGGSIFSSSVKCSVQSSSYTSGSTTGFASGSATIASGDYLTVDLTQIGSTYAGADLGVQINWS